jgi:hypothetical protein
MAAAASQAVQLCWTSQICRYEAALDSHSLAMVVEYIELDSDTLGCNSAIQYLVEPPARSALQQTATHSADMEVDRLSANTCMQGVKGRAEAKLIATRFQGAATHM